jgi:hypothetical protein
MLIIKQERQKKSLDLAQKTAAEKLNQVIEVICQFYFIFYNTLQERNELSRTSSKKISVLKTEMCDTLHELELLVQNAMKAHNRDTRDDMLQDALTLIGTSKGTILNI